MSTEPSGNLIEGCLKQNHYHFLHEGKSLTVAKLQQNARKRLVRGHAGIHHGCNFERELRARKVIAAILAAEAIAQEHVEARERHPLLRRHVFARSATTDGSPILVTTPAKRLP
jgi:hypothetical protein